MKKLFFILVFYFPLFISNYSFCQWQQTSEPKDSAICLAINGGNGYIFAGTGRGGVYLSTDNGASWSAENNGLSDTTTVLSLAINGKNGNIFAGTADQGVFLSTNNGGSWAAVNSGIPNFEPLYSYSLPVLSLAISGDGANIFAGTYGIDTTVYSIPIHLGGVYLSTNNGEKWKSVDDGNLTTGTIVFSLLTDGANVFAGTKGGVFLSTNNGGSWTAENTGLTNKNIFSFDTIGGNIYAGTGGEGVFLSTNNGTSWTAANNGLASTYVRAFAISGANIFAGTVGEGVFLSTNNGGIWNPVNTLLINLDVLSLAISGTYIYAGTGKGVWKRTLSDILGVNEVKNQKSKVKSQIYPNPVNEQTVISYQLSAKSQVILAIYDITGMEVTTLVDEVKDKGEYSFKYNTEELSSGVYFVRMMSNNGVGVEKLIKN